MARTELAVQTCSRSGLEATYTAFNADGHYIANTPGRVILHVKNGATDAIFTQVIGANIDGQTPDGPTVTCTASEERFLGPWTEAYHQPGTNRVHIDVDDESNVTVAAIRI